MLKEYREIETEGKVSCLNTTSRYRIVGVEKN